jgi:hypothetical protein
VELVGHVRRHEDLLAIVLVAAVSVGVWFITRRNEKRVVEEIEGTEDAAGVT